MKVMSERHLAFDGVRIECEREVPTQDLIELIDELSQDFLTVDVRRKNYRIAAAGLTPDVGVAIIIGAVAASFLAEVGKDLYKTLRGALFRLYDRTRIGATGTGRVWPVGIVAQLEAPKASIFFLLEEGLNERQFDEALRSIPSAMRELGSQLETWSHSPELPVARFDPEKGCWELWDS
jgi:hypothetical protein